MGHLGFSYTGLFFLLMLIVPNLTWTRYRPKDYTPSKENKVLLALERIGQVCTACTALLFSDTKIHGWSAWSLWLAAAVLLMILYECWWIRYFKSAMTMRDFYRGFLGVPVAGATLPVAAFFLLGVYGKSIWLMVSAGILGIGHIGIHLQHRREMRQ